MKHIKKIFESEEDSFKNKILDYTLALSENGFDIIIEKCYKYTHVRSKDIHYINKAQIRHQGKEGVDMSDFTYRVAGTWYDDKLELSTIVETINLVKRFEKEFECFKNQFEVGYHTETYGRSKLEFEYIIRERESKD